MAVDALPTLLQPDVDRAWQAILENADEALRGTLSALPSGADTATARRFNELSKVLACSRYAAESFRRRPALLAELLEDGALDRSLAADELKEALGVFLAGGDDPSVTLRRFRRRQILRIIWRDLNRLAVTQETMGDVSALADACIDAARRACTAELEAKFGTPIGARSGQPQELVILAMGKLGGWEITLDQYCFLITLFMKAL